MTQLTFGGAVDVSHSNPCSEALECCDGRRTTRLHVRRDVAPLAQLLAAFIDLFNESLDFVFVIVLGFVARGREFFLRGRELFFDLLQLLRLRIEGPAGPFGVGQLCAAVMQGVYRFIKRHLLLSLR